MTNLFDAMMHPRRIATAVFMAALGAVSAWASPGPAPQPVDYYASEHEGVLMETREFTAADGMRLSYTHYRHARRSRQPAIVYLHGIESHMGWFEGPASLMAAQGYDVYCLDRRGSGLNRENKGLVSGHMSSYRQLFSDIDEFRKTLADHHARIVLAGSSWGGKLALAYTLANPDDRHIEALILVTPGLRARVDLNPLAKVGVLTTFLMRPQTQFDVPIQTSLFTSNPGHLDLIRRDPLRLHEVSARFYIESLRLDRFIDDNMHRSRLPILLLLAGRDRVIDNEGVIGVLRHGRQEVLEIRRYENETHAIQIDAPRQLAGDMMDWLERRRERPVARIPILEP